MIYTYARLAPLAVGAALLQADRAGAEADGSGMAAGTRRRSSVMFRGRDRRRSVLAARARLCRLQDPAHHG